MASAPDSDGNVATGPGRYHRRNHRGRHMAQMFPAIKHMFVSSSENASSLANATAAATTAPATPATGHTTTPAPAAITAIAATQLDRLSCRWSLPTPMFPLKSLWLDLTAAHWILFCWTIWTMTSFFLLTTPWPSLTTYHPSSYRRRGTERQLAWHARHLRHRLSLPIGANVLPCRVAHGDFSVPRPRNLPVPCQCCLTQSLLHLLCSCLGPLRSYHRSTLAHALYHRVTWTSTMPGPTWRASATAFASPTTPPRSGSVWLVHPVDPC